MIIQSAGCPVMWLRPGPTLTGANTAGVFADQKRGPSLEAGAGACASALPATPQTIHTKRRAEGPPAPDMVRGERAAHWRNRQKQRAESGGWSPTLRLLTSPGLVTHPRSCVAGGAFPKRTILHLISHRFKTITVTLCVLPEKKSRNIDRKPDLWLSPPNQVQTCSWSLKKILLLHLIRLKRVEYLGLFVWPWGQQQDCWWGWKPEEKRNKSFYCSTHCVNSHDFSFRSATNKMSENTEGHSKACILMALTKYPRV